MFLARALRSVTVVGGEEGMVVASARALWPSGESRAGKLMVMTLGGGNNEHSR